MPTYVYEYIGGPKAGMTFELFQSIKDDALTHCPTTGHRVRRVILPPMILGDDTGYGARAALKDNDKLTKMGFTKYERASDGTYERTAGTEGPRHVDPRGGE